jgi:hypothetical protein
LHRCIQCFVPGAPPVGSADSGARCSLVQLPYPFRQRAQGLAANSSAQPQNRIASPGLDGDLETRPTAPLLSVRPLQRSGPTHRSGNLASSGLLSTIACRLMYHVPGNFFRAGNRCRSQSFPRTFRQSFPHRIFGVFSQRGLLCLLAVYLPIFQPHPFVKCRDLTPTIRSAWSEEPGRLFASSDFVGPFIHCSIPTIHVSECAVATVARGQLVKLLPPQEAS